LLVPVSHHDQLAATRLGDELSELGLSFLHRDRFHARTLPHWAAPGESKDPLGDHRTALFSAGFLFLPAACLSLFLPAGRD
jgi:hypothetical protein